METALEKQKNAVNMWLCIGLCVWLWPIVAKAGEFNGGVGIETDPYRIATTEQLLGIATDPNASYILMNDIDLTGQVFSSAPINTFSGHFDGGDIGS